MSSIKFPFLVSHMTCLYKHQPPCNFYFWWVIWLVYIIHQIFLFLEIPSQTISCSHLYKPSKYPFLVFPYMVSHMIITTHPVPLYPRFLPNQETLLNQVTGSSPPAEWLIIQEKDFLPLWWIKKTQRQFSLNSEIFPKNNSKTNKDYCTPSWHCPPVGKD